MDQQKFKSWLIKENKMQYQSAAAVVSRYNRAIKLLDGDGSKKLDEAIFTLSRTEKFQKLSSSIRSQLKRALNLHDLLIHEMENWER